MITAADAPLFLRPLLESVEDDQVRGIVDVIRRDHPCDSEISALLARILARSGQLPTRVDGVNADVASTGGPSSLSTLICPLFLVGSGAVVPKLGVEGRPAGGIDCLAQIPGYRIELNATETNRILSASRYTHTVAGRYVAPLDRRMFKIRQEMGAQRVPTLVASSLLAKKLVMGVDHVGLEIRVAPHGNFGTDWDSAKRNAELFRTAAHLLRIRAVPILTDGRFPYQPYIGRREALLALNEFFTGNSGCWLASHFRMCKVIAQACLPSPMQKAIAEVSDVALKAHFDDNVAAQGGTIDGFEEVVSDTRAAHKIEIYARNEGFCSFPLAEIRHELTTWQRMSTSMADHEFPDPVGLILRRSPGEWVNKGDLLATVRAPRTGADVVRQRIQDVIGTPGEAHASPLAESIK